MWTTCGETERTRCCLRPTTVFGTGSFLTFPETGTVEDSRNFRNEPGGGGGVETGREIRVSVVEWCYKRTLFLGLQEERDRERGNAEINCFIVILTKNINTEHFSRLFCSCMHPQHAASLLHSAPDTRQLSEPIQHIRHSFPVILLQRKTETNKDSKREREWDSMSAVAAFSSFFFIRWLILQ